MLLLYLQYVRLTWHILNQFESLLLHLTHGYHVLHHVYLALFLEKTLHALQLKAHTCMGHISIMAHLTLLHLWLL